MPGYGDIGGSWRDLSGGGYANIGGSWRQITEGYQNRNGVWEKVFPNYADYGGDTPELSSNGYIDLYGYYSMGGTGNATQSSLERYASSRRNSLGVIVGGTTIDASATSYQFFPTKDVFDARGYNYMAFVMRAYITTNQSSSGNRHNFQIMPFVSFAAAENTGYGAASKNITGSVNSSTVAYDSSFSACTFVDLSNCTVSDLYLRVGYMLSSSWDNANYNAFGYVALPENTSTTTYGIYLYKEKSECSLNGSNYNYSWTLTY